MFNNFREVQNFIDENEIRMIDLKWCDLAGHWRHVTISAQYFTPQMLRDGIGFDGSSVGLKPVNSGDLILIPDLGTGFPDPFSDLPTLSFYSDIYEADSKQQFMYDPRSFIERAEKYLTDSGIADRSMWGPEYEFFIFDEVSFSNRTNAASYLVDSYEGNWEEGDEQSGYLIPRHQGYHRGQPSDQNHNLRSLISATLEELVYPVKYHHHEGGGPGHGEIEPPMMDIFTASDGAMMTKYIAKNLASLQGKTITFMPKPLFGEAGSGMHFHQLLFKGKKNLFYDPKGYNNLSDLCLYYIGGLLTHAPALTAITNPSTNSYKRLAPGFEAPTSCFFGTGDRTAAIRQPKYVTDPAEVRIEYRTPDGSCNAYLAIPAMLLAGLDGIKRKIDPRENDFGPFEDMHNWDEKQWAKIKRIPSSLREAAAALEQDHAFLLEGGVFSEEFIAHWVKTKRKEDIEFNIRPHPYEFEQYLDC
ncbi:MAG: type I glutamate--ammonia ligase [Anaerolineaceae bacterium]|jgi:glutamine synthetase